MYVQYIFLIIFNSWSTLSFVTPLSNQHERTPVLYQVKKGPHLFYTLLSTFDPWTFTVMSTASSSVLLSLHVLGNCGKMTLSLQDIFGYLPRLLHLCLKARPTQLYLLIYLFEFHGMTHFMHCYFHILDL